MVGEPNISSHPGGIQTSESSDLFDRAGAPETYWRSIRTSIVERSPHHPATAAQASASADLSLGKFKGFGFIEDEVKNGFRKTKASNKGFNITGHESGFRYVQKYYAGYCRSCVHVQPCSDDVHLSCLRARSCKDKAQRKRCVKFQGCRKSDRVKLRKKGHYVCCLYITKSAAAYTS
eukprot:TRINITY_DN10676_c0_g1_i1.p2 TRINITY_DN10676_c0_g1~~TRINITY_DN10676_c0_g1_i1.p2  ORF type:complete len:177 (+),score=3.67 TRINITY_DN10676_c0_g1_i1:116-646(+)